MKLAPRLQFLKLGGSLITDKSKPSTPFPDVISRLAAEIAAFVRNNPGDRLVIGHGSGSFGHFAGKKYNTRQGVYSPEQWLGFAEVWRQASMLHRLVIEALAQAGTPRSQLPTFCRCSGKGREDRSVGIKAIAARPGAWIGPGYLWRRCLRRSSRGNDPLNGRFIQPFGCEAPPRADFIGWIRARSLGGLPKAHPIARSDYPAQPALDRGRIARIIGDRRNRGNGQ